MLIHELKIKASKSRKRIGRGGNRGTFSGRGVKGQKSRAGGTPRPQMRDFLKKFPKRRGLKQNPKPIPRRITIATLDASFDTGAEVTVKILEGRGLVDSVRRGKITKGIKVLGQGDLTKKLIIDVGIGISAVARDKILKAGGKIKESK